MSKDKQKQALIDMMQADEADGLYTIPMSAHMVSIKNSITKCKETDMILNVSEIPNSKEAFNQKYKDYLEPRFYGLEIGDPDVIYYLDQEFEKEIKQNPTFQYSQIKLKFGRTVIYCNKGLDAVGEWEEKIDEILLINKPCK